MEFSLMRSRSDVCSFIDVLTGGGQSALVFFPLPQHFQLCISVSVDTGNSGQRVVSA